MKYVYSVMDWDKSEGLDLDEFRAVLNEIGEHVVADNELRCKWLWKMAKVDHVGEINFAAMVELLDYLKDWRMDFIIWRVDLTSLSVDPDSGGWI